MILYGMRRGWATLHSKFGAIPVSLWREFLGKGLLRFLLKRNSNNTRGLGDVLMLLWEAITGKSASAHTVVYSLSFLAEHLGFIVLGLAPILGSGRADCFCSRVPATLQGSCSSSTRGPALVLIFPLFRVF